MHELSNKIQEALDEAPAVISTLKSEHERIGAEIKRLESFVTAMSPKPAPTRARKRKSEPSRNRRAEAIVITEHNRDVANAIMSTDVDAEFTVKQIHVLTGSERHGQATAQAFNKMRKTGFIGKMGVDDNGDQRWKIMDTEAGEQFMQAVA